MSRRPSFQFYPPDWRNDPGLRLCSMGARGLWIEMMCLMHEGEPYGHLTLQGRAINSDALSRLVGESPAQVKRWLRELGENNVYSIADDGALFSRRMVRDEEVRQRRAAGGDAGGKHGSKGGLHGAKGGRPPKEKTPLDDDTKGGFETPLDEEKKPPPSSSSSSSSSESPNGDYDDDETRVASAGAVIDDFPTKLIDITDELARIAGVRHIDPGAILRHQQVVKGWLDDGLDPETEIAPAIRQALADSSERIQSLKYFDTPVRNAKARKEAGNNGYRPRGSNGIGRTAAAALAVFGDVEGGPSTPGDAGRGERRIGGG